jgi:hypothetical protein
MFLAAGFITGGAMVPTVVAAFHPNHEYTLLLNGAPAFAVSVALILLAVLYIVGFVRYCASKGYSKWLGFWLLLGNVPGFIVMLLLPDLTDKQKMIEPKEVLCSSRS